MNDLEPNYETWNTELCGDLVICGWLLTPTSFASLAEAAMPAIRTNLNAPQTLEDVEYSIATLSFLPTSKCFVYKQGTRVEFHLSELSLLQNNIPRDDCIMQFLENTIAEWSAVAGIEWECVEVPLWGLLEFDNTTFWDPYFMHLRQRAINGIVNPTASIAKCKWNGL